MPRTLFRFFAAIALLGAAACNTIEGAGRDLQVAGQNVEREAQQAD